VTGRDSEAATDPASCCLPMDVGVASDCPTLPPGLGDTDLCPGQSMAAQQAFRFGKRRGALGALDLVAGVLDALDIAVSGTDLDGRVFFWNPANERLYGYSREEVLGSADLDLAASEVDRSRFTEAESATLSGEGWSGLCRVRCAGGRTAMLHLSRSPLLFGGAVAGAVTVARAAPEADAAEPAAEVDWLSLTDAELKVARLVAQGLTNRETAERLVVSRHTVDSHLKHVFTKLTLSSRVQLTRALLAHDRYDEQV
jgi:PAS domain S-box-containing protein